MYYFIKYIVLVNVVPRVKKMIVATKIKYQNNMNKQKLKIKFKNEF